MLTQSVVGEGAWKAGVATADITPEKSLWMGGYAARKGPSQGVQQPLYMKLLLVEDSSGDRLAIVTMDLIGVPKPFREKVEKVAEEKFGIQPESLLLNASHTHSGPMIRTYQPPGGGPRSPAYSKIPEEEADMRVRQTDEYGESLIETVEKLLSEAEKNLAPSALSYSRARCGFAMNRRTPVGPGDWRNKPNPDAPVDHEVPLLQVRQGTEKELVAVLFGYSCHATVLSGMEFSGDWPGYAQEYFEKDHPGVVAMFVNGCSGDQNPYPRRMLHYAQRHGRSMATAIEAGLETPAVELGGSLHAAIAWERIPYQEHPTREELEKRAESKDFYDARFARFLLDAMDSDAGLPVDYPVPVQVIRFGSQLTMVTIGGEVVVDYSLRLKDELGELTRSPVWVAGYSNDVMTYIPSRRVLEEGGYEGGGAMRYVRSSIHPAHWDPSIEERLVGRILALTRQLQSSAPD
ncbi:MAG: neutral/alkaline non-lysosomal ceramidase N-terminal domain-containing protein [Verrucomicrobiales bacterium]|nr:neutral/alkaline non-lysosomal ceramidase N-terminal domain-containing protein [Verrucomicrobiales bacterium]